MLAFDREGSGRPVVLVRGITESRRPSDPIAARLCARPEVGAWEDDGHSLRLVEPERFLWRIEAFDA